MLPAAYEVWLSRTVAEYAAEHVQAGNWEEAGALARSVAEFHRYLPDGLATPGQFLFSILPPAEAGQPVVPVGVIWFGERAPRPGPGQRRGWIYDLYIEPEHRRRGYARQAMRVLEAEARARGFSYLGLHVFGANHGARALYESLGYEVTNVNMGKNLG
jgi:ribosomal protein S18 acetylase RimI-like enzyme